MELPPDLLCAAILKHPWGAPENNHFLIGIPPHMSLLYKMDITLTKQGALVEQVVDALKTELDEHNIGGGYDNTSLVGFF